MMVRTTRWVSLVLPILVVAALLAGCAKAPAPAPTQAPTQAPAKVTAPAPAKTTAPAPAKTQAPAKPAAPTPAPAAKAQSLDDFFANTRVTLIVPFAAGGASDYAARLYASFWTEVTGGSMVVKCVPGGGAVIGVEQVYAAKPDGRTLGFTQANVPINRAMFNDPPPKFDATKFTWLGYFSQESFIVISAGKKPYNSLDDLKKAKGLTTATKAPTETFSIAIGVAADLLGLDIKIIPGFDSATDQCLALARGEVDLIMAFPSYLTSMLKPGDFKKPYVVVQRERSAIFPDVPAITELVKLTPEQEKYMTLVDGMFTGRGPYTPPGMDKAMVDFLRDKTKKVFALKAFVQQAKLQWKDWEQPWDGVKMQQAMVKASSIDRAEGTAIVNKVVKSRLVMK